MVRSVLLLSLFSAYVVSDIIAAFTYYIIHDMPNFWANTVTSIGWFWLLNYYLKKTDEKQKENE